MRSFVVAGICLLMASSAMAATQVDLVARGIGPVVDPAVDGTSHVLDVIITSDTPGGMTAASFGFQSPEAVQYDPFLVVYGVAVGNYGNVPGFNDGGAAFPANTNGWSTQTADGANPLPGGDINGIIADDPVNEMSTIFGASNATSGLFGWLEVNLVDSGAEYMIDINGTVGDAQFQAIRDVVFNGLTVTPEPVSALLLLLGVPFLRRRR